LSAEQAVRNSRLCTIVSPEGAWLANDASIRLSWWKQKGGSIDVKKLLSLYKTKEESTPLGRDGANVVSSIEGEHNVRENHLNGSKKGSIEIDKGREHSFSSC
jgi:hypothetical protein